MTLATGLLLALLSTAALSYGFYLQHTASGGLPALSVRHPLASLCTLFTNWQWLVGFVTGLGGWALYIAALRFAPLSLVQATSAGGVGLLVEREAWFRNIDVRPLSVVRIERRKAELMRARAGVEAFLREDVLPGGVDIAQAALQR